MCFKQCGVYINKFRYEIIAVIFTIYGIYLRVICLLARELWVDEVYSLQFMQGAFKPFWQRLYYSDLTYFPGEYIINWPFVFLFKTNKWGIAIPHILFAFLSFYFLYRICKRYLHSIFAWVTTFALVAVHRDLIFHSFELRPYAVLPTLALAAFYYSEQIVSNRYYLSLTRKALIGFIFIFIIIYHTYGIIILLCSFAYVLLRESGKRAFKEAIKHSYRFITVIILLGVPLFLWFSIGNPHLITGVGRKIFEFIPDPSVNFFGFIKTVLCCLTGNKILYFLAISLLFPFIFPFRERLQQIGFLLIMIVFPLVLILFSDILVRYWFVQRQFAWIMPLFAFFIGWSWDSLLCSISDKLKAL